MAANNYGWLSILLALCKMSLNTYDNSTTLIFQMRTLGPKVTYETLW